jgi:glucose/arabinose dehydrogenase
MKWIAAAGTALLCLFFIAGTASGASLVRITPDGYLHSDPSFLTSPPGDGRVFLVERGDSSTHEAEIRIIKDGTPVAAPFLTVDNVDVQVERGLLSLAFAPDYATSGLFYVFYAAHGPDALDPGGAEGDIRIVQYRGSPSDPDKADPASARIVLSEPHSAGNHNGGWMAFGPDGHLYFSIGDNANSANAQSLSNLYGKIMRIDPQPPSTLDGYTVPADNPFVGQAGARAEIYALGLRNPYRASFAPDGRLVIGDVGNGTWEEVDAGDLKGANLGWPTCEGFCSGPQPAFVAPVFAYRHDGEDGFGGGNAIIGGYVVRDAALGGLTGRYLFGDLSDRALRTLDLDAPGGDFKPAGLSIPDELGNLRSFGEDSRGCVYVLSNAAVFRVVGDASPGTACPRPPEPPVDAEYSSHIPRRSVVGRKLKVGAKCTISCSVTATARIKIGRNRFRRKPARFSLKKVHASLAADQRGNLILRIPIRRVKSMKKALRNHSRVTARIKVTMTGEDGSGGSGASSVRLVRPKRR